MEVKTNGRPIWTELDEILHGDFHGQIILHCNGGEVRRYEIRQTMLPRKTGGDVELARLEKIE